MTDGNRRGLAAVMFADMVGFTALMGRDEVAAREARDRQRDVVQRHVERFGGRVRQFYGDGTLSVFGSAVQACRAAIEILREVDHPPRVALRIGIHVGDIVEEPDGVYGDGVNVAARVEALAAAGGIVVSDKVYDEIKNHPDLPARSLGRVHLKNVSRPVEVYALMGDGLAVPGAPWGKASTRRLHGSRRRVAIAVAACVVVGGAAAGLALRLGGPPSRPVGSAGGEATPGSGRALPSIAVIPFENRSADGENAAFLADGLHDELLTHLANIGSLEVIARTSVMRFSDTRIPVGEIARMLDVGAVLEGRVQRSGNRILLNAQLIDGANDAHLWAHTYERELTAENVFAIQRELADDIARSLRAVLSGDARDALDQRPTASLEAYNHYLEGLTLVRTAVLFEELDAARIALEEAIRIDPSFAEAYAHLAYAHLDIYWNAYDRTPERLALAREAAARAEALAPGSPETLIARGYLAYWGARDYEAAERAFATALAARPGEARIHEARAYVLRRSGRWGEARDVLTRALALDPLNPEILRALGELERWMGNWTEAEALFRRSLAIEPGHWSAIFDLAWLHIQRDGSLAEAAEAIVGHPANGQLEFLDWSIGYMAGDDDRTFGVTARGTGPIAQQAAFHPRALLDALQHRARGRSAEARRSAEVAARELRSLLEAAPLDPRLHATAGIAAALLGRRDEALAEGREAVRRIPVNVDAVDGQEYLVHLATIHALLGENDDAAAILLDVLSRPTRESRRLLVLQPHFRSLCSRPEFAGPGC